ncbi:conserved hypothetical protein [Altererythrobacter sp. B11]|uniref:Rid family hydrolase n=1 Tax=Altererythrobacter sp. B11 TaxID=2060312 RepID=UPI000DC72568|nr:Rid family hydrolase [Altererythrobacter sp. B11]BBC72042.1 conserved hypothetical protein [Altererythrobacter sp. B11]
MAEKQTQRQRIAPLSPFEEAAGFTRALRAGDRILVSGTVGVEADGSVAEDAGAQADRCFALIASHVEELGGSMADVVRVRMFVTDITHADAVTAAFTRALGHVRPVATLVASQDFTIRAGR